MARGFESKQVESQQEEAARGRSVKGPALSPEQRLQLERRRLLMLARTRAQDDLSRATAPAYRKMLEEAIAALDTALEGL